MSTIEKELAKCAKGGVLRPETVVDFARNPKTALHDRFEWDDTAAAQQYRIDQARHLIRACVTYLPGKAGKQLQVRAYVSLESERRGGESYRPIEHVLSNTIRRGLLLDQALRELQGIQDRYATLRELDSVWAAVEKLPTKRRARKTG